MTTLKLRIGDVNAPAVLDILHRMRQEEPTLAAAAKMEVGFGPDALHSLVRAEALKWPGIRQHCLEPAQKRIWSTRHAPAGMITAAQPVLSNAITYAMNIQRLLSAEVADVDDGQGTLPL